MDVLTAPVVSAVGAVNLPFHGGRPRRFWRVLRATSAEPDVLVDPDQVVGDPESALVGSAVVDNPGADVVRAIGKGLHTGLHSVCVCNAAGCAPIGVDGHQCVATEASVGKNIEIYVQNGSIVILPAAKKRGWNVLDDLGKDAPKGKLRNPSEKHDQYLYSKNK